MLVRLFARAPCDSNVFERFVCLWRQCLHELKFMVINHLLKWTALNVPIHAQNAMLHSIARVLSETMELCGIMIMHRCWWTDRDDMCIVYLVRRDQMI